MAEALSDVDGIESLMNLTRKERAMIAEDTLQKLNLGWYSPSGNSSIHFSDDVTYSVNNSILYNENDLKNIERKDLSDDQRDSNPKIEIRLCTTLQSTQSLVKEIGEEHVGVLNFASAKNPGGGFRNGAQAQEESLCRTSSLYLSLTQNRFVDEFYDFHRRSRNGLYSHRIIYSPRVTFFKVLQILPISERRIFCFRMIMEHCYLLHIVLELSHVLHPMLILFTINKSFRRQ